jgi:hypothetical protein
MTRRLKAAAVAVLVAVLGTLAQSSPSSAATAAPTATTVTVRQLVGALPVRAESYSTTYQRTYFKHWTDANGDCQDTRAEVLIAESRVAPTFTSSRRCTVARGRWVSPWELATWTYPSDVDIDHVVALKEAWESGARAWGPINRERFANDLGHPWTLEAVTDNVNQSKSDRDPSQWLPPAAAVRCSYVAKWAGVKYRWKLSVDPNERTAMLWIASGSCGSKTVALPARAI